MCNKSLCFALGDSYAGNKDCHIYTIGKAVQTATTAELNLIVMNEHCQ